MLLSYRTYFNSTLVRLREFPKRSCSYTRLIFQFHIGAIKSKNPEKVYQDYSTFQFHIGAIKRIASGVFEKIDTIFQFHIGAIKS